MKLISRWADFSSYVTKYRFSSYWHQFDEVFKSRPEKVLEIGVGPHFVSSFLGLNNIKVVTVDIEKELKPGLVGTVRELPFVEKAFDTVLCCQVLEHLPFEEINICLEEIHRVCNKKLVLSLADKTLAVSLFLRIPNFVFWEFLWSFPVAIREPIGTGKEHQWEIGRVGCSFKRIARLIEGSGFSIERTYRVGEFPYHRFFIARPL